MSTRAEVFHPNSITAVEQRPHISAGEYQLYVIRNRLFRAEGNSAWGRELSTQGCNLKVTIKKIKT